MEWSLTGLPLPIVLRPPSPLTDDELIAFSCKNKPYRIEKDKIRFRRAASGATMG